MLLKLGDVGFDVHSLQRKLFEHGYKVTIDGVYGEKTEAAVKRLQKKSGLVEDGIYGLKTATALNGKSTAKLLKQKDIESVAKELDVSLAVIMAVNEVESLGTGFLDDGRPKILFERHIFYRSLLDKKFDVKPWSQRYPNIVNAKHGGYVGNSGEYSRLSVAMSIDKNSALESCSWGLFQIMGHHWDNLGYSSIQDFVNRMKTSEAEHIEAFKRFVLADAELLTSLRNKKWAEFAAIYNGTAYRRNLYDVKLERAYEHYAGVFGD